MCDVATPAFLPACLPARQPARLPVYLGTVAFGFHEIGILRTDWRLTHTRETKRKGMHLVGGGGGSPD